jgi:hypothetical protein
LSRLQNRGVYNSAMVFNALAFLFNSVLFDNALINAQEQQSVPQTFPLHILNQPCSPQEQPQSAIQAQNTPLKVQSPSLPHPPNDNTDLSLSIRQAL